MITVQPIDETRKADIRIPNEPFPLRGRLIPTYDGKNWDYSYVICQPEQQTQMCFLDENYDYSAMCGEHIFLGAYDGDVCIGLAVLRHDVFKYMYIYDLKVNTRYRRQQVGKKLIECAKTIALSHGYRGLYVHAQDNNINACMFYLGTGFHIGGFDCNVYAGTNQEGKSDITFYLDAR